MIEFPINKIIDEFSIPEPKELDRDWWHPSALGGCPRGIYLERKGITCPEPFEPRTYQIFEYGNLTEKLIIDKVVKGQSKYNYTVEYQKKVEIPEWNVRGTLDMQINTPDGPIIYDVKSVNSNKFKYLRQPDEHYRQQVWLYLYATKIQDGAILYVSKDNQVRAVFPVFLNDEKLAAGVKSKLEMLNACWKEDRLPEPAPTFTEDGKFNWRAGYCRWHTICTENPNWKKEALSQRSKIIRKITNK